MFDTLFQLYSRPPFGESPKGRFKHGHAPEMRQTTDRFVNATLNPKP